MTRGGRTAAALVLLAATGGAAVYALHLWDQEPPAPDPTFRCTVSLDGAQDSLSAEQTANAAIIAATSQRMGMPARGATIGIATALQESSLVNLDHGDRDSLGLFQQRPSQGWGTEEQVQDPYYATETFYRSLLELDGWVDMEVTDAAQRVQRSAFPEAYATREHSARLWASALRGHSGAMPLTCDVPVGVGTTAQDFAARVARDFGTDAYRVSVLVATQDAIWLDIAPADDAGDPTVLGDAFAAWAVAVSYGESVEEVANRGEGWRAGEGLAMVEPPVGSAGVAVRLTPVPVPAE